MHSNPSSGDRNHFELESDDDEETYDHLDHSRPITEVKAHYQRMPSGPNNTLSTSSPALAAAKTVIVLPGKANSQEHLA